jgi:hypothetical protein
MASLAAADHGGKVERGVDWVAIWIVVSAWCQFSGWTLSLFGSLNRGGYAVALLVLIAVLWFFRLPLGLAGRKRPLFKVRAFHPRRWLPKIWLLLALLAFVGGLIHPPNNYDHLSYRFTRLLHWAWEQKWHRIDTENIRMNLAATGFEWLMAPSFVLLQTDRFFFLINITSFLLLPGLIFSVFHRLGISKRVSWWWMWVLPTGYCYLVQAGSVSNDLFATVYFLASFHFVLRAEANSSSKNFVCSCLAMALTTGAKISNVPLGLPWLLVCFLNRKNWLKFKPMTWGAVLLIGSVVSILPIIALNIYYTGDYSGDPHNKEKMKLDNPVAGVIGNSLMVVVDNSWPPLWPTKMSLISSVPAPWEKYLKRSFPRFDLSAGEMQVEESAGVGLGITVSVILMIILRAWAGMARPDLLSGSKRRSLPIFIGMGVALIAFISKLGNEGAARLLAPYYPLLIAGLLVLQALDGVVIRFAICRIVAFIVMFMAVPLVIASPQRPLFPTDLAVRYLAAVSPAKAERMQRVYEVYGSRYDGMKDLFTAIPGTETSVGLIQTGDVTESILWRPYGSRRIVDLNPDESIEQLKADRIHFVIVYDEALNETYHTTLDQVMTTWSARVVMEKDFRLRAKNKPEAWHVIELQ